jgi:hypothetical protein
MHTDYPPPRPRSKIRLARLWVVGYLSSEHRSAYHNLRTLEYILYVPYYICLVYTTYLICENCSRCLFIYPLASGGKDIDEMHRNIVDHKKGFSYRPTCFGVFVPFGRTLLMSRLWKLCLPILGKVGDVRWYEAC